MDGGKIIDAVTLMERVEKGRAPSLGRVVGIVGGGNTAMDAARMAKRLGAEEAVIIFRFDKAQMEAHPYEAMRPSPKASRSSGCPRSSSSARTKSSSRKWRCRRTARAQWAPGSSRP